jgi:LuxR family maltose regulon positive regulatory protein
VEVAAAMRAGAGRCAQALPRHHVPRPRLTGSLDAAAARTIVLCAPAGYGKTTLALEWLAGKERVAWCTARPGSADLAAFPVELAEAAAAVLPGSGARMRGSGRAAGWPNGAARPLAELLAVELADWPADAWLAIDDYHLLAESAEVEEFMDWLLALSPLRLVVTTRVRPGWATARRVLHGELFELGADELAMTVEEGRRVVGDRPHGAVAALLDRAQGWPAIVGLARLASALPAPEPRIADALFRYVAEEVFRREPEAIRSFMLAAAVPPRVDADVAAALGLEGAAVALQRLEREGLLVPAVDGGFRFHPLVRDFLLEKLRQSDPGRAAALARAAVEDARAHGRGEEAFELALAAGDRAAAADVLADEAASLFAAGRGETVERQLAALGDEASARPALVLAQAEVLLRRGDAIAAADLGARLAERLPDDDPFASAAWYVRGRALRLASEDERALDCHLRAAELAATPADLANALWGATALAAQLERDVLEPLVHRLEAAAGGDLDAQMRVLSAKVFVASRTDSLAGLWSAAEPVAARAGSAHDPNAATSSLLAASYVACCRSDYSTAQQLGERAVELCARYRLGRLKTAFSLHARAAAEIGLRRLKPAERTLAEVAALGLEAHLLLGEHRNLRMKLALARHDAAGALALAGAAPAGTPASCLGEQHGLAGLAAAAEGHVERARSEAAAALALSRSIEARWYARFALLLARLREEGPSPVVAAEGAETIAAAAAAGMDDAFVLAYRAYPPLLRLIASEEEDRALAADVVAHANDHALARRLDLRVPSAPPRSTAQLTPRESEVLELMAEGLANREIARQLFISEKTTKVHVGHIFNKLGVESRVQAVLAAQRLAGDL